MLVTPWMPQVGKHTYRLQLMFHGYDFLRGTKLWNTEAEVLKC